MGLASRVFNRKQALEKEVKDVYAKILIGDPTAPTLTLDTTTPIVLTKSSVGTVANTGTVEIQVSAPAANPTDTVLANVTGTAAAIVITIVPNDGTNNTATPVPLTTEELAELLDTGSVVGKTVTVTDAGSLLANIASATGGDTTDLAEDGEGDGETGSWSGGVDDITNQSVLGIASVERNDVGDYSINLDERWFSLKSFKCARLNSSAEDISIQLHSESVNNTKEVRFLTQSGTTPTDPASGTVLLIKLELKNSGV